MKYTCNIHRVYVEKYTQNILNVYLEYMLSSSQVQIGATLSSTNLGHT